MAAKILTNAGNIPVDRRTKVSTPCDAWVPSCANATPALQDGTRLYLSSIVPRRSDIAAADHPPIRNPQDNQKLFAKTFDYLKYGDGVAIFPEGGSFTTPQLGELKHGASWAALEYAKNLREQGRAFSDGTELPAEFANPRDVVIVVAGISYTDKQKYRSSAVMKFGRTVSVEPYVEEFLRGGEEAKAAVKRLTGEVEGELRRVTVNAQGWDELHAANMARKMLWVNEHSLPLQYLRDIDQT